MFKIVDGRRTDDGRTPEHGYSISSPCEPEGSGELKINVVSAEHSPVVCKSSCTIATRRYL